MSRRTSATAKKIGVLLLTAFTALTGCHPTQPFYLHERGDLAHYLDTATDIEYPDEQRLALSEASGSQEPLTILDPHFDQFWDLTLEEAICIALYNSKVVRTLTVSPSTNLRSLADILPESILRGPESATTVFDPALVESNPGSIGRGTGITAQTGTSSDPATLPGVPGSFGTGELGVEAALAQFDAEFKMVSAWRNTDSRQNSTVDDFAVDQFGDHEIQLAKRGASGTEFYMRANADYSHSDRSQRVLENDWTASLELEVRQPLLRGAGTQVNRSRVVIARINTDRRLADFEVGVRNLIFDVERTYWDLYSQYRILDVQKVLRDSNLSVWREQSVKGGGSEEAQARREYFRARSDVQASLQDVFKVENRLRYLMGLAASDGRMIRPADEPVSSKVEFDWGQILCEALHRSPELRRQKWLIKRREMELIVARNDLLPDLNINGQYRWLGVGNDLIEANRKGLNFPTAGSLAWDELTGGNFQEAALGLVFRMPIGFRKELAGVRWAQLNIARDKAVLDEMELELTHALTSAYQDLEAWYRVLQTNFNWFVAAQDMVNHEETKKPTSAGNSDLLLRAYQNRSAAQTAYYQALQQYNQAIAHVHYRKGSLLKYNSVQLAEGPWQEKAYFDALGHARRRDASHYLNYGYTRPRVISSGPIDQMGGGMMPPEVTSETLSTPARPIDATEQLEEVPESFELPPVPDPSEYDAPQAPIRTPAEMATTPEGPELAPPRLMGIQRTGAGLKSGTADTNPGGGFDWAVVQSRLQPVTPAKQTSAPVMRASHASVLKQPGNPSPVVPAGGTSIKVKTKPQPAPTPAGGWKTAG